MPGCEDPVNTTDTKTKGRATEARRAKGQPATLLFSRPQGTAGSCAPQPPSSPLPFGTRSSLSVQHSPALSRGPPAQWIQRFSDDGDLSRSSLLCLSVKG